MRINQIVAAVLWLFLPAALLAHISIFPQESAPGAREKYTMRVPNEKQVNSVKIEAGFPPELKLYDFEFKPGWKIDLKKDAQGNITGATWTGTIAPYEFVEFGMLGINPKEGTDRLVWKCVQYYEDGKKEEFTGPPGSFYRAPMVMLKAPAAASTK